MEGRVESVRLVELVGIAVKRVGMIVLLIWPMLLTIDSTPVYRAER